MQPSSLETPEAATPHGVFEETKKQTVGANEQVPPVQEAAEPVYELFDSDDEDYQRRCDLLEAIVNAPTNEAKRKAQKEGCEKYHKDKIISKKQLGRYVKRYLRKEFHLLSPGRKDKGQFRKNEQWYDFIVKFYKWGQSDASRISINQVYTHLCALAAQGEKLNDKKYNKKFKGFPKVREELVEGKHPSHPTVYKYVNHYLDIKPKKPRHGGSPFNGQVLQTSKGIIELTHTNVAWQCDHTKIDVFVVDEEGDFIYTTDENDDRVLGRPFLTVIQDAFSGCIMGFHLGLEQAGSAEVALAFRNAILPKNYGPEYDLEDFRINDFWKVHGLPENFVTDQAEEFTSNHMKHIARQLKFKLWLRKFPQAGGLVETIFDKFNKELNKYLPGYTGSNVKERPKDAENFACLTLDELEIAVVRYIALHWNNHNYPKSEYQITEPIRTRYSRWRSHLLLEPKKYEDERELDVCLLKSSFPRDVNKPCLIHAFGLQYEGKCIKKYVGKKIQFRYDERNVTRLLAYTLGDKTTPERYIGTLCARNLDRIQLSLEELKWIKAKLKERGKEVNNLAVLAIYAERLGMVELVEKSRSQRRRTRRNLTQAKRDRERNQSTVVELFPDKEKNVTSSPQETAKTMSEKTKLNRDSSSKPKKPLKRSSQRRFDKSIMNWDDANQRAW